jgi:hypothetical protein
MMLPPPCFTGGHDAADSADDDDPGRVGDNQHHQRQQQQQQPGFADLATLSSLLALQPSTLLSHLPPAMHAMGGCLRAALVAADRLVTVSGDRGCLLVSQDMQVALGTVLLTSSVGGPLPAASSSCRAGGQQGESEGISATSSSSSTGSNPGVAGSSGRFSSSGGGLVGECLVRLEQQVLSEAVGGSSAVVGVRDLLPDHELLAAAMQGDSSSSSSSASSSGSTSSSGPGPARQLSDAEVVLLRVRQLKEWQDSPQYQQMMASAKPLRRVLLHPNLRSNCRGTSA